MTKSWMLVFVGMAVGISVAHNQAWLFGAPIVVLLLGMLLAGWHFRMGLLVLGAIACGMLVYSFVPEPLNGGDGLEKLVTLQGKICNFPVLEKDKSTFFLKLDQKNKYLRKVRVSCYYPVSVAKGDTVQIQGTLKKPRVPGNPGAFDYPAYLREQGIFYLVTSNHAADLKILKHQESALKYLASFRQRGEEVFKKALSPNESALLLGMLLGSMTEIDEDQYDDFQHVGIVHLFSVSGLHVGFLLLLMGWITSFLSITPRGKFYAGIVVLFLYGTMVGWPVAIVRAVLMASLGLLAYYSGRENSVQNALALSGVVILLVNPLALFGISFQLSFLATWGLIYLFPVFRELLPWKGFIVDLFLLPLCAEIAVMPVVAYHFNLFSPISILTNILVSYLSGAAVILGFIALLLAAILPFLATLVLYPAGFCMDLIVLIVDALKGLPLAYTWVATPSPWFIIIYYSGMFLSIFALKERSIRLGVTAVAALLICLIFLLLPASVFNRGHLEVVFIDVGQGDSILIKTPPGKFLLIDGGGNIFYDVGKTALIPYLHHRGIRKLDMVINTHPDVDHLDGLIDVVQEMQTDYIGISAPLKKSSEYQDLSATIRAKGIPLVYISRGQQIRLDKELSIDVLHPSAQGGHYQKMNGNNQSVVLRLRFKKFSMILTGDIEMEAMEEILKENDLQPVTVVKVPHHGSKYSADPAFYQQLKPRYAVISVGASNGFGHPHQEILNLLEKYKIRVLRTDRSGAILFDTDGTRLRVQQTILE